MTVPSLRTSFVRVAFLLLISVLVATPHAFAATKSKSKSQPLEFSGWLPYWRSTLGIADTKPHLSQLTEVNPFGYTVKQDGTLNDTANLSSSEWQSFMKEARGKGVRVVPTVMWSDTAAIERTLNDPKLRAAHVKNIVDTVTKNNFDGIDIDYEGKTAGTREGYSAFLKELADAFAKKKANKWLSCTIEARMPLEARFAGTPPANIEYANDLPMINRYCDRVRIMTYDQQTADLQLNAAHSKELYAPVADTAWVEKVATYMGKDIDSRKMVLGVATYGYIYQAMPNVGGSGYSYTKLEAFNPKYGVDTAAAYGITPVRNSAGELSFSYVPKETTALLPTNAALSALAPKGTTSANLAAAGALTLAKTQNRQAPVQFLTWSDDGAIKQKVDLARKLGLRGIAVFKLDGGADPDLWSVLK